MHLTTLKNKLRVLTLPSTNTAAVTVMVMVGAGSRYETKAINGISHFLEHLFFKGGEKYPNSKAVAEAVDNVGGQFNAFTGKEYAGYYVKVAKEHAKTACDVLSDMLLKTSFSTEDIDKERGVILEEYNMYQDTPMYKIGWQFEEQLFGDQPIGWDQIGTPELIKSVTQEQFREYKNQLYTPDNIVIGFAGNITEQEALEFVDQYFYMPETTKAYDFKKYQVPKQREQKVHTSKKTEQTHLVIGTPAFQIGHEDEWALKLLGNILGGSMSSRMFLNIREAHGLTYYIHTSVDCYTDAGIISTSAGVDNQRVDQAIEAIITEYEKIATSNQITEDELQKTKNSLQGRMTLNLEDSQSYIHMLTRQQLLLGKHYHLDDIKEKINSVTLEQINQVAKNLFHRDNLHISLIGPNK